MIPLDEFKKSGVLKVTAPLADLRAAVQAIEALDRRTEGTQGRLMIAGLVTLLGGIAIGVLGLIGVANGNQNQILLVFAGLLSLVVGIVLLVVRRGLGKTNYEDRRYRLVDEMLKLLGHDAGAQTPVDVRLDLRPATHDQKHGKDERLSNGLTLSPYLDPWLSLSVRLVDGTAAQLTMTERVRIKAGQRHGSKRFKRREKRAHIAGVTLRVKGERFPGLAAIGDGAQAALRLPEGVQSRLKVTPRGLSLRAAAADWTAFPLANPMGMAPSGLSAPHLFAMMLFSLYRVLDRCRPPRAATVAAKGA